MDNYNDDNYIFIYTCRICENKGKNKVVAKIKNVNNAHHVERQRERIVNHFVKNHSPTIRAILKQNEILGEIVKR